MSSSIRNSLCEAFSGLSEETKKVLLGDSQNGEFTKALGAVLQITPIDKVVPPLSDIFNAYKLCPIEKAQVVIIGQDPYIKAGEAHGLSFSVKKGVKLPPSLVNLYKCLIQTKLLRGMPVYGDLSEVAKQGILFLNVGLTTEQGVSERHLKLWRSYSEEIIRRICSRGESVIFILLGNFAKEFESLIKSGGSGGSGSGRGCGSVIFSWGHPSPLNATNRVECPANFINCDAFGKTNLLLTFLNRHPIDWNVLLDVDIDPVLNVEHVIFTDGACQGNGKQDCRASWAFIHYDKQKRVHEESGIVQNVTVQSSNNRGELFAILQALKYVAQNAWTEVCILSDSMYCINTITEFYPDWIKTGKLLQEKKNIDLLSEIDKYMGKHIKFNHVRSHQPKPTDASKLFIWTGNDEVDKLAVAELKK